MLAKKLRAERFKNGAMKFEGEELHFDVDADGRPTRAYFKRQRDANKLIEEFMLLANRTVAEDVGKPQRGKKPKTLPYRIHENPDPQKLEELRSFVVRFGYKLKTAGTTSQTARSLNQLMDDAEGTRMQKLIQTVALRAMMKAKYSVHNIGHFGLAFPYYTHFTPSAATPTPWCTVCSPATSKAARAATNATTKSSASTPATWNSSPHRPSASL